MARKKEETTKPKAASKKSSELKVDRKTTKETINTENPAQSKRKLLKFLPDRKFKLRYVLIPLILLVVAGLLYGLSRYLVIAWVDRQPITRFEYYNTMEKRYGEDVREQMIVEKLILNEARKRNVSVSEEEVNQEIKKLEEEQGGADQLAQVLQAQGISKDELNKLVRLQLLRQKMFGADVNVTDEDVNKYIEENREQFSEEVNDELRAEIKNQLQQQRTNQAFNSWLQEALRSNRVERV